MNRRTWLGGALGAGWLAAPAAGADPWERLDAVAEAAVAAHDVPGVVLTAGRGGRVLYQKAFGSRAVETEREAMTVDTVFDLASLTKPIATAHSVMGLVEEGRIRLSDRVTRFWPEFAPNGAVNGKERITLRHLLTHSSGLPAYINFHRRFVPAGEEPPRDRTTEVMGAIAALPLPAEPDTRFTYSDLGFLTLGEVVRRVTGQSLDQFARRRIFEPLGMRETGFIPPEALRRRAAPTTRRNGADFLRGQVHDENAATCGGVAGHAGLFSTAKDLSRFVCSLLGYGPEFPLSRTTVRTMQQAHSAAGLPARGLGWDLDTGYSHVRGDLMPPGKSFGHTGFTGTFLWIDPGSEIWVVGLSNRVHPSGGGNPLRLWALAANLATVAAQRKSRTRA